MPCSGGSGRGRSKRKKGGKTKKGGWIVWDKETKTRKKTLRGSQAKYRAGNLARSYNNLYPGRYTVKKG